MLTKNVRLRPELARDLGLSHAGAVVVGTIIVSGIFLVPSEMMQAVGSARMVYLVWLVGGLLSFFGALTYAELGAMKTHAGSDRAPQPRAGAHSRHLFGVFVLSAPLAVAPVRDHLRSARGHRRGGVRLVAQLHRRAARRRLP